MAGGLRALLTNPRLLALVAPALVLPERLREGVAFNPLAAAFRRDPYHTFRALREREPVHRSTLLRGWVVTGHAEAVAVLRDPRFSANQNNARINRKRAAQGPRGPRDRLYDHTLLNIDPPQHTRLRSLVNRAFTPRTVEALRPRVRSITDELLERAAGRDPIELIGEFAYPLPLIVITELLGVPRGDRARFRRWSFDISLALDPLVTPDALERADTSVNELCDYLRAAIEARRQRPAEDLLSALVAAEEDGKVLSEDEMLATCILLLVAGHETTSSLIGNAMLALLRHPEQRRRLQDDPALIEPAVEELLRFDSPVAGLARVAMEDLTLGEKPIKRRDLVFILVGAANRDPAEFRAPERLDLTRGEGRHITFGYGSHFCIGSPLARLEAQTAIATLLRRYPEISLAPGPLRWRENLALRGLKALPVRLGPPAP